jgi:membrane protease subunit HflC
MKRNLLTVIVGAVLVLIFVLLLFTFQVRKSEDVVVSTFLKPTANRNEPGLYFKLPWPIQSINRYDQRIQNFDDKYGESYTRDSITLMSSVYVGWKISDASVFIQKFPGDPQSFAIPNAQNQLERMVRTAKLGIIAKYQLSDIVNADPKQLKFDEIEQKIEQSVQAELSTNNYGIQLEFLGFKKIGLPETVTTAVFDRMKAERMQIINGLQATGDSQAMNIRSAADRQASVLLANAQAEAQRIRGEGEAEAAKTYTLLNMNTNLATFLLQISTLPQVINPKTTLFIDQRTPPFNLLAPANVPSQNQ